MLLPEREVARVVLLLVNLDPSPRYHILGGPARKPPVVGPLADLEIHPVVRFVGDSLVDQRLDLADDRLDVLRHPRESVRVPHPQHVHDLEIGLAVGSRQLQRIDPALARPVDDLVVHVGEILHVLHPVAAVFQVAAHHIGMHKEPCVTDVRPVLRRHPTYIHPHHVFTWHEITLTARGRVIQSKSQLPPAFPRRG